MEERATSLHRTIESIETLRDVETPDKSGSG